MKPTPTIVLALAVLGAILAPVPSAAAQEEETSELARLEEAYRNAADVIAPSVVQVYVRRDAKASGPAPTAPRGTDPDYYVRPDAPVSGVIVGEGGLVLTSAWNVDDDPKGIEVRLPDGRKFEAKRLGYDEIRDLALLSIEAKGLPAAPLEDTGEIAVGQFAIVVSRSQSVERHEMNVGIVSATGRYDDASFQLDARTNYGSAGGAVVDLRGRLIGIVSRIADRTNRGQNSGIGFATPTSLVRQYLPDYEAAKVFEVPRPPFLGIQADQSALDVEGVRIAQVIVGTAAEAAGLQEGDVIVEFNGTKIAEFEDLVAVIRKCGVGAKVQVTFVRGGETKSAEATLGERPVGQ